MPATVAPADSRVGPSEAPIPAHRNPFSWKSLLIGGLVLWVLMIGALLLTQNLAFLPPIAIIGAGTVPLAIVLRNGGRLAGTGMILDDLLYAFLVGGAVGILLGGLFDAEVARWLGFNGALGLAGFVEEAAKAVALLWIARRVPARSMRSGIYLGAAVGAGFATFETTYYAMSGLLNGHRDVGDQISHIVGGIVGTEVFRALLSPFMHILWTAILGGVLFAATRNGKFRLTWAVLGTYVLVALLHGTWDRWVPEVAQAVAKAIDPRYTTLHHPTGDWTAAQAHVKTAASLASFGIMAVGYLGVIVVGLLVVRALLKHAHRLEDEASR